MFTYPWPSMCRLYSIFNIQNILEIFIHADTHTLGRCLALRRLTLAHPSIHAQTHAIALLHHQNEKDWGGGNEEEGGNLVILSHRITVNIFYFLNGQSLGF